MPFAVIAFAAEFAVGFLSASAAVLILNILFYLFGASS